MNDLAAGDVVVLKSGGPMMTVISREQRGELYCKWFAGDDVKNHSFPVSALRRVESENIKAEPKL